MLLVGIKDILESNSLRNILRSRDLAHLGDFLANFIYTSVKIGLYGIGGSVHVWDNSLTKAMELSDLRKELGKKTKPDKVADAGEALIAFAYFSKLLTIEEMVNIVDSNLDEQSFESEKIEKQHCAMAFSELFTQIITIALDIKKLKMVDN